MVTKCDPGEIVYIGFKIESLTGLSHKVTYDLTSKIGNSKYRITLDEEDILVVPTKEIMNDTVKFIVPYKEEA